MIAVASSAVAIRVADESFIDAGKRAFVTDSAVDDWEGGQMMERTHSGMNRWRLPVRREKRTGNECVFVQANDLHTPVRAPSTRSKAT